MNTTLTILKHGYNKAKLEFRFRETSNDNSTDKFRINVHIFNEQGLLLTLRSPCFRTVVRSPQRGKFKLLREQLNSTDIVVPFEQDDESITENKRKRKK